MYFHLNQHNFLVLVFCPPSHKMQMYRIHDNREIPFHVKVTSEDLQIYKVIGREIPPHVDTDEIVPYYEDHLMTYTNPHKVFIGTSPHTINRFATDAGPYWDGNSILVQPKENELEYVFIGSTIFSFTTNTPIHTFYSPIGNNVVPYPYAVSDDAVYNLGMRQVILFHGISDHIIREYIDAIIHPFDDIIEFNQHRARPGFNPQFVTPLEIDREIIGRWAWIRDHQTELPDA